MAKSGAIKSGRRSILNAKIGDVRTRTNKTIRNCADCETPDNDQVVKQSIIHLKGDLSRRRSILRSRISLPSRAQKSSMAADMSTWSKTCAEWVSIGRYPRGSLVSSPCAPASTFERRLSMANSCAW